MDKDNFLSLCDLHNSIIHEYGCDISCQRQAGVCIRGCSQYEHKQKSGKHQFVPAKEFYQMVNQIRHKFRMFQQDFKEVYLKGYIQQLKKALDTFEGVALQKFQTEYSLVEIFSKSSEDTLHGIIQESEEDIQFADLKCKEIHQIKHLGYCLAKDLKKDEEKRISRILTKIFEEHLRGNKLLGTSQKEKGKSSHKLQIVEGKLEDVIEKMKGRLQELQKNPRKNVNGFIIKLKERFKKEGDKQYQKQCDNFVIANELTSKMCQKLTPINFAFAYYGQLASRSIWQNLCKAVKGQQLQSIKIVASEMPKNIDEMKSTDQMFKKMRIQIFKNEVDINYAVAGWDSQPQYFEGEP